MNGRCDLAPVLHHYLLENIAHQVTKMILLELLWCFFNNSSGGRLQMEINSLQVMAQYVFRINLKHAL